MSILRRSDCVILRRLAEFLRHVYSAHGDVMARLLRVLRAGDTIKRSKTYRAALLKLLVAGAIFEQRRHQHMAMSMLQSTIPAMVESNPLVPWCPSSTPSLNNHMF